MNKIKQEEFIRIILTFALTIPVTIMDEKVLDKLKVLAESPEVDVLPLHRQHLPVRFWKYMPEKL